MSLRLESYALQRERWPKTGRHILAQFDGETIVVYQAYRPAIGRFAASRGYFGEGFSLDRMTWIKPNFLWMMYRSGWGTKEGQEVTVAVTLRRAAFDAVLAAAVPSTFDPKLHSTEAEWKRAVAASDIRLQWDPDHHPSGAKADRRAIQLGLRGDAIVRYAREWIVRIEDVSRFVEEQRRVLEGGGLSKLMTPREEVYPVPDAAIVARLGLDRP